MNTLDLLILLPILWGVYKGYQAGFLATALALLSFFVAIVVGFKFWIVTLKFIKPYIGDMSDSLAPYIAFIVTFIIVFFLTNTLAKYLKKTIHATLLGRLDQALGAVLGAVRFAFFVSLFLMLFQKVGSQINPINHELTQTSILYPIVEPIAPYVVKNLSKVMQFGENIIQEAKDIIKDDSSSEDKTTDELL